MGNINNLMSELGAGTVDSTTEKTDFPLPPKTKVVFYNDDFTTMDFVVEILINIFNKSYDAAYLLMKKVHNEGSSIVGEYTYDIAVSRKNLAVQIARKNGFPLRVEIE